MIERNAFPGNVQQSESSYSQTEFRGRGISVVKGHTNVRYTISGSVRMYPMPNRKVSASDEKIAMGSGR